MRRQDGTRRRVWLVALQVVALATGVRARRLHQFVFTPIPVVTTTDLSTPLNPVVVDPLTGAPVLVDTDPQNVSLLPVDPAALRTTTVVALTAFANCAPYCALAPPPPVLSRPRLAPREWPKRLATPQRVAAALATTP